MIKIPFNRPYVTGKEHQNLATVLGGTTMCGDGPFTHECSRWLEAHTGAERAFLTHSCTAALEMTAILADIQPGDEVIMPSFTFVSTANAFVLRGGVPVFVDIREDTLNIDETLIEGAVTDRTKAIVVVHYAGVSCAMDVVCDVAERHSLVVIEDAAQGIMAGYKGRPLGSLGDMSALSFHETKNLISGEGGALLVSRDRLIHPAEVIREKGTDRSRFFRGEVDKYSWQDIGSSYLPNELTAAMLMAQFDAAERIQSERMAIWNFYYGALAGLEDQGLVRRPIIPEDCQHNAHLFYVLLPVGVDRAFVLSHMKQAGIHSVFHYVPLHSAPAGEKYCRVHGGMQNTNGLSERLIRLPMWIGLTKADQQEVIEALRSAIEQAMV